MATLVEKVQVICVEQGQTSKEDDANHNKVWQASLMSDNSVLVEWGRVGKALQSQIKSFGSASQARSFIDKKKQEKYNKGYVDTGVVSEAPVNKVSGKVTVDKRDLNRVAQQQIKYSNPLVSDLIDHFSTVNAHQIMEATRGAITYNATTGAFATPLGQVGQLNIDEANRILIPIGDIVAVKDFDNPKLMDLSQQYLRYIPTDIGMRRFDPRVFWRSLNEVQAQKQIVDALQASLVSATTAPKKTTDKVNSDPTPSVFDVQLDLVEDGKKIDKIRKLYEGSKGDHYDVRNYKVKTVYAVRIASEREAFKNDGAKMDNIWTLWHGTKDSNCLSILKQGLVIPPASSSHCTGRLFSDGVYASDMSTKALRYATGGWGKGSSKRTFMFILDMAMGRYYEPNNYNYTSVNYPVKGYDSTFAKAGRGGIMNNEMIVYRVSQVQLNYLVEFENR